MLRPLVCLVLVATFAGFARATDGDTLDMASLMSDAKPDEAPSMAYAPDLANSFIKDLVHGTAKKFGLPTSPSRDLEHAQARETELKRELKTMNLEEASIRNKAKEQSKLRGSPCAKLKEEEQKKKLSKCASGAEGTGRGSDDDGAPDDDSDPRDDDEAGELEDESAVDALDSEATTIGHEIRKLKEERKTTEGQEEEAEHDEELAVLRDDAQKRRIEDEKIMVERDEKEKALLDNKLADLQLQKARDEREAQKEEMSAEQVAEERRVKRAEDKVKTLKHSQAVAKKELHETAEKALKEGEQLTPAEESAMGPSELNAESTIEKETHPSEASVGDNTTEPAGNSTVVDGSVPSECNGQEPCIKKLKEELSSKFEAKLKSEEEAMNKKMAQMEKKLQGKELEEAEVEKAKEAFGSAGKEAETPSEAAQETADKQEEEQNKEKQEKSLTESITKDIEDHATNDNGEPNPEEAEKVASALAKVEVDAATCARNPDDPACANAESPDEAAQDVSEAIDKEAEKEAEASGGGVDDCNPPKDESKGDSKKKCKKGVPPGKAKAEGNSTALNGTASAESPQGAAGVEDEGPSPGPDSEIGNEIMKGESEDTPKEIDEAVAMLKQRMVAQFAKAGHGAISQYADDVEKSIKEIAKKVVKASLTDKSLEGVKKRDADIAEALNKKESDENRKTEFDVDEAISALVSSCTVDASGTVVSAEDESNNEIENTVRESENALKMPGSGDEESSTNRSEEGKREDNSDAAEVAEEAEEAAGSASTEAAQEEAEAAETEKEAAAEVTTENVAQEKKKQEVDVVMHTVENAILRNVAHAGQLKPGGGEEVSKLSREIADKISAGEITPEQERDMVSRAVDRLKEYVIQVNPQAAAQHFGLHGDVVAQNSTQGAGRGDVKKEEGSEEHSLEAVADKVEKKIETEGESEIMSRISGTPAASNGTAVASEAAPEPASSPASKVQEPIVKGPITVHDVPNAVIEGAAQQLLGGGDDGLGGLTDEASQAVHKGSGRPPIADVEKKIEESVANSKDIPAEKKAQIESVAKMVANIEDSAHHSALAAVRVGGH